MTKNKTIVLLTGIIIILIVLIAFPKDRTPIKSAKQTDVEVNKNTQEIKTTETNIQNVEKPSDKDYSYMFVDPVTYNDHSSVVGYFDRGTLVTYIPKWLEGYWTVQNVEGEESTTIITPAKDSINDRDFTDIVLTFEKSDETYNAEYLYNIAKNNMNNDSTSEILLNNAQDTTIYHVTKSTPLSYDDIYYIDGNKGKTVTITFSASRKNYFKYASAVKTFIQGLGKGLPRG